ncbi:MAG: hypothetical protein KAR85_07050 [Methanosarcinales archaeon]|nr:hypothetical protein [Methanosarcinales archaeon]
MKTPAAIVELYRFAMMQVENDSDRALMAVLSATYDYHSYDEIRFGGWISNKINSEEKK